MNLKRQNVLLYNHKFINVIKLESEYVYCLKGTTKSLKGTTDLKAVCNVAVADKSILTKLITKWTSAYLFFVKNSISLSLTFGTFQTGKKWRRHVQNEKTTQSVASWKPACFGAAALKGREKKEKRKRVPLACGRIILPLLRNIHSDHALPAWYLLAGRVNSTCRRGDTWQGVWLQTVWRKRSG